ncbi:UDP-N-acetylmuramate dehydrogenase [Nesterenkonia cremea]|uniref:UDP-N-acetylenolpyruvoylglucosamine reductase n=1 Tax=Nesterenkonia cremea TaxID=1882340 RepID=A0A917ATF8_9MICC|nr:UDP-N-acetylmuramate dehydrogenase [Nesterenkonia cremea]GGE69166.1 UDP-N-acetylenolpyruvoylglucosamine reductase [Nesterenkonia cremea]
MTEFAENTTARVGGSAGEWIIARTEEEALAVLQQHPLPTQEQRAAGQDSLLVLGGGSNLLVSDAGFGGTVLQLAFTGISAELSPDTAVVTVAAGANWDRTVAWTVDHGCSGLEALSGIPGSAGATPVQNVGAYGADVSQTLLDIRAWDRAAGELITLEAEQLEFGYRNSLLKRTTLSGSPRYVVLSVRFALEHRGEETLSAPVRYGELARSLGLEANAAEDERRAPLQDVRAKVLALRAGKGMVLDDADPDTYSTGSFFTNPIVPASAAAGLPEGAPRFPAGQGESGEELVKLSAAWLIDQSGCAKGFGAELTGGRASLSTKHTLAVTNRGTASAEDLLTVARAARDAVKERFGVELRPEPVLLGCTL